MYAEAGLLFPYFQNFSEGLQQYDEFCRTEKLNASMDSMVQLSMVSEYDMGAEGDLFKAPEPIIEEPVMGLDPVTAAISMVSCGEDVMSRQALKVADIESFQQEQLLNEVLYECEKDLFEQAAMDMSLSEVLDIKIPSLRIDGNFFQENKQLSDSSFQKSISSESLSSMEWMQGSVTKPNFLDFPVMDFSAAYGMRRAFSEGDIKTLGNGNISLIHSPHERPMIISKSISEERKEKLSRYRNKKTKRNFGRKIKYACRKALADNQPRIRGRFAKTEESDGKRQ
ncbi:zinc finger protein CONSTANS-LIKE 1-like isoform X1 [Humulus lupulus]|uniref:zinc finger protein CONSTANS-LIKE 1-like isoform X1 n=2 Tax=Humulus lupulus TaxID=3486 RepID=UPI002B412276|nr:zinc finger protein CONSTANS-LIKE 1-like isoform X1 [Humulus lupulus]